MVKGEIHSKAKIRKVLLTSEFSRNVGLAGPFESPKPFLPGDHCEYKLAVAALQYSRRPGKHASTHTQHETVRKLKSAYGNWVRSSSMVNQKHEVILDDAGKVIWLVEDIPSSLWYQRFNAGMKYRMGNIWNPNKACLNSLDEQISMLFGQGLDPQ